MTKSDLISNLKAKIAQSDALYIKKIERLELRVQQLESIIDEFADLVNNSDGVYGLHLNGDLATWKELMDNNWLKYLQDELDSNNYN